MLLLASSGCRGSRNTDREALEATLARAVDSLDDTELRQRVDDAWQAARRAEAHSRAASWNSSETADLLWASAVLEAHQALAEQRMRRQEATQRWKDASDTADELLARLGALDPHHSQARRAAEIQRAERAWERAQRRHQEGDLSAAVAEAEETRRAAMSALTHWDATYSRFENSALRRDWSDWTRQAIRDSQREGAAILVDKVRRQVQLWRNGRKAATFDADLGRRGLERKLRAGDQATPEGRYRVTSVRKQPATRYYKALMLDYPNERDRARLQAAIRAGQVPKGSKPGSLIEIHGHGGRGQDWTDGCIALADRDMDALWSWARNGLSVTIVGTVP